MKLFLIDISWLFIFSKFGYPVSVENTKKIFLKPPDSPVEYGINFGLIIKNKKYEIIKAIKQLEFIYI